MSGNSSCISLISFLNALSDIDFLFTFFTLVFDGTFLRERKYCNTKFFFQWNISFFSFFTCSTFTDMFFELLGNIISRSLDRHCVRLRESSTLVTSTLTRFKGNEGMMVETGRVIRGVSSSSHGRMSRSPSSEE